MSKSQGVHNRSFSVCYIATAGPQLLPQAYRTSTLYLPASWSEPSKS